MNKTRASFTNLSLIGELNYETTDRKRRFISVAVIDTLRSHIARKNASIRSKAGNGDADVIVDFEDLLLVRGEFRVGLIDAG